MTESAAAEAKTADLNRYTAPHAIWEALATDTVKLLRASSLVELAGERDATRGRGGVHRQAP